MTHLAVKVGTALQHRVIVGTMRRLEGEGVPLHVLQFSSELERYHKQMPDL